MNQNIKPAAPNEQIRMFHKMNHATFSRHFKARHDADTVELLAALKMAKHRIFVLGGNTDEITAILKKHGVV